MILLNRRRTIRFAQRQKQQRRAKQLTAYRGDRKQFRNLLLRLSAGLKKARSFEPLAWCFMERVTGIEPALSAWKAEVLPLNHTRDLQR